MEEVVPAIGRRKFVLCLLVLLFSCLFLAVGKLAGEQFTVIVSVVFASFSLANGAEHLGGKFGK